MSGLKITTLVIPTKNDSDDEIKRMCDWVVKELGPDVPLHFSAFHPDFKMLELPATPADTLRRVREIALSCGVQYAYTGNVHDDAGDSTKCHHCGKLLIQRDWYELNKYKMRGNCCSNCGTTIPGVFEETPGDWGRKRQPVRLSNYT